MEISRSGHSFYDVTFSTKGQVRRQRYGKRHKKALGKARKSGAKGENLKIVSEFCNNLALLRNNLALLENNLPLSNTVISWAGSPLCRSDSLNELFR